MMDIEWVWLGNVGLACYMVLLFATWRAEEREKENTS